jgi:hypothetical protein
MPCLSHFYGIKISMYGWDHNPPHFHAIYGEYNATFDIHTLGLTEWKLPPKAMALVVEWATLNQDELYENREKWQHRAAMIPIRPLS